MANNLSSLITEQINNQSTNIDQLTTIEIIELMNAEDRTVADAVHSVLPEVETAIDVIYQSLKNGGRLFYTGAGTSGRLGVLDAAECPPTFLTEPDMVQALIAGGESAIFRAVEGAEDSESSGAKDLELRELNSADVVVGIAASGRTPYVIGGLKYAQEVGAETIALSCNKNSQISSYAKSKIEVMVGPEVLTGSTRLKAATAQKMILNMITTTTMIKLGKVYKNFMIDLKASNKKLIERARNMVSTITGVSYEEATKILHITNQRVKPAIVMIKANVSYERANELLLETDGFVHHAIKRSESDQVK